MRHIEAELISKRSTKFLQSCINNSVHKTDKPECSDDSIGGIIKKGQLGWLAQGPLLEVHSLRNGQKISSFRFDHNLGFERCVITCISEINAIGLNCCILAIGILFEDTAGGIVALYSVKESKVVRCIEIKEKVTSCQFIASEISKRTILHMMQGCLAVGTDTGKIFLLDLNLSKCEEVLLSTRRSEDCIELVPCHIVSSTLEFSHIRQHHKHAKQENINFGIELESVENPALILSMLSLTPLLTLVVGLEDGRMILYDLSELQPFHMAYPPERLSPLVKLAYLEPPDDPRACLYIWAFHENPQTPIAVMHSIMYDKKIPEDDGICLFEGFQCCNVRLTLPMYECGSLPITCQSITKMPTHDDEDMISICLLAWKSKKTSEILLFDINQWYKEEMPRVGDWRDNLNYLAHFTLKDCSPLDVYIDPATVAPFNSIQRPEEHFHPISLCFDCTVIQAGGSFHLHWPGLQHRALDFLRYGGSTAILEPNAYFNEIMGASLLPQFSEYNYNSTFSIAAQREILLSVSLEYNCFGLLKECAKSWADGSYLGRTPNESLSLSTLTEWIWNRAKIVKNRCNILCVPLFDHSGLRIDQRSQKELSHLSRQLRLLADLFDLILKRCREYIPDSEFETLTDQYNSIRMASEYQEVLQWLLNIGLLPEGVMTSSSSSSDDDDDDDNKTYSQPLVPYPYKILKSYYMNQRRRFGKLNKGFISSRTQSCRILYIDSFIEHECNANIIRDHWQESGGNGLYPPPSLQAMLRTLLVPDISIENKYILFIYLFLDLNMAIEDERYVPIVHNLIKFPAVFKLNASLIKTVQAFWNLDHGQFEIALEEIVSPFSQDRKLSQWQQELLIEALLAQDQANLALQALQARVSPISSLLELKTLLANDLVAEAYHLQRSKHDPELLRTFLKGCLYLGKWGVLRDLALTDEEGKIVEEFLRQTKSSKAENLHFVYLLQRSKYVEAISYLDELSKSKHNQRAPVDLETPNLVLSAYNLTMTPATKQVSDTYCNIRNRIKSKDNRLTLPMPLSCELLKSGMKDISGGIYHSSAVSTDQATIYWDEGIQKEINRLLDANNVPFIRQPQLEIGEFTIKESLSYPEVFKGVSKRRLNDSSDMDDHISSTLENPLKRRRIFESSDSVLNNQKSLKSMNSSLLTRFKDKTLRNHSLSEKSVNITCSRQDSGERSSQLLSTPIVKSSRIDFKDDVDMVDNNYERVCTPHSILKVRNIMQPLSPSSSIKIRKQAISNSRDMDVDTQSSVSVNQDEAVDEEKSIRFEIPRRSDITDSLLSVEEPTKSDKLSTGMPSTFGDPKKRKPIRSVDTSAVTLSDTDEFYSPIQSRDVSKVEKEMESESENEMSVEKSKEEQEEPEDGDMKGKVYNIDEKQEKYFSRKESDQVLHSKSFYKNIHQNIGDKILENISTENSPLKRRINITEGPKARPPLKRSRTPPSYTDQPTTILRSCDDRQTRSRSRSRTPAEVLSSPSRRSSRLVEKSEKCIEPRKPLSRMVLEVNAKKTITSVFSETVTTTITCKTPKDSAVEEEKNKDLQVVSEKKQVEVITKKDSLDFKPTASSSRISKSPSKFQSLSSVAMESTQTDKESNICDISLGDICSTTISTLSTPAQILPDDSILSDSFTQNWKNRPGYDHTLMTTMDMSSFSGDISLETFEPPGNLLSDSESDSDNKKIIKTLTSTPSEIKTEIVVKEDENKKIEDKLNETTQNNFNKDSVEVESAVAIEDVVNKQIDEDIKPRFTAEEMDVLSTKDSIEEEEFEDEEGSVESISDEDDFLGQNESMNYEYSDESSIEEQDESYDSNAVINISSSSDEVTVNDDIKEETKEITEKSVLKDIESKKQTDSSKYTKEELSKDISDLLYGDIDTEGNINVQDKESDVLNDAIIINSPITEEELEKDSTDIKISFVESLSSNRKDSSPDNKSKIVDSSTTTETNTEEDIEAANKSFDLEPAIPIGEGMTLNFLTGEEEKLDETGEFFNVHKLNEARLEETSLIVTESEVSCVDTSASDYKSFTEDKTISSISAMEIDEDPFQSVNSSKNLLNEQILDDTVKMSERTLCSEKTHTSVIKDSAVKRNTESECESSGMCKENTAIPLNPTDDCLQVNIPLLIVSPPEDSNNKTEHENKPCTEFVEKYEPTSESSTQGHEMSAETHVIKDAIIPEPENIILRVDDTESVHQTVSSNKNKKQLSEENIQKRLPEDKIGKIVESKPSLTDTTEMYEKDSDHAEKGCLKASEKGESTDSTVQDPDTNDEKLQVSVNESSVGPENEINKTTIEISLKSKTPDRSILRIESTTLTSGRLLRNRRARSESLDIKTNPTKDSRTLQNILRATSVPRTDTTGTPKQKKLRALSESSTVLSPNRILTRRQSQILERIEEDNLLDSPSTRTRSRKRHSSVESDAELSSPTMSKQIRRLSTSYNDMPGTPKHVRSKSGPSESLQSTPRRILLAKENLDSKDDSSDDSETSGTNEECTDEKLHQSTKKATVKLRKGTIKEDKKKSTRDEENEEEQKSLQIKSKKQISKGRTTSRSSKISSVNDPEDTESTESEAYESDHERSSKSSIKSTASRKLGSRMRKELEDLKGGGDTYNAMEEDLSTSRRLTRNQASAMERIVNSPIPEPRKKPMRRPSKTDESPLKKTDQESEVESVASGRSKISSVGSKKRSTRSSVKEDLDDNASIASSTRSRASIKSKKGTKAAKGKNLKVIHESVEGSASSVSSEEETEPVVNELKGKRGRPKKSNK